MHAALTRATIRELDDVASTARAHEIDLDATTPR